MNTNDSIIAKKGCYILGKGYPYIIVAYSEHENNILYSEYILLIYTKSLKDNYWIYGEIKSDLTQNPVDSITVDTECMITRALEKARCILCEKVKKCLGDKSTHYLKNNGDLSNIDKFSDIDHKKILLHLDSRDKFKEMFSFLKEKVKCKTLNKYIHKIATIRLEEL